MSEQLKLCPEWTDYAVKRPTTAGVYEWRIPNAVIKDLVVIFAAHMRMRGNGYSPDILSPSFDHWNGYEVLVPLAEWRDAEGRHADLERHELRVVSIDGLDISPCPYCTAIPEISAFENTGSGIVINPSPERLNDWRFKCCQWGTTPWMKDPRAIEQIRRKAWNTRPADPVKKALADALKRFLQYWESDFIQVGAKDGRTLAEQMSMMNHALTAYDKEQAQ